MGGRIPTHTSHENIGIRGESSSSRQDLIIPQRTFARDNIQLLPLENMHGHNKSEGCDDFRSPDIKEQNSSLSRLNKKKQSIGSARSIDRVRNFKNALL